jgi:hypothetical protein
MRVLKTYVRHLLTGTAVMLLVLAGAPAALTQSAQEADLRRQIFDVNPFLYTGRPFESVTRDACEFWPGEPTLGFPHAQNAEGLPDTLIISITGDPATPCVNAIVANYLINLELLAEGDRCFL